jgi:DNA polymerase III alpha subunit
VRLRIKMSNKEIIPVFYDHTSLRGIMTAWAPDECKDPNGPQSFLKLAKDAGLKKVFYVSSNFEAFRESLKNANKLGLELIFGLQMWLTDDSINNHSEQSLKQEYKIIIFAKNGAAYKDLSVIYTDCNTNTLNKYYKMRYDIKQLRKLWTKNLILAHPYVDSYLAKNRLVMGASIVPDFDFIPKQDDFFLKEVESNLPFSRLIDEAIDEFTKGEQIINVKSCYYEKPEDCRANMIYRTIQERSKFCKPDLRWFCSDSFNFQNWKGLSQ